MRKFRELEKEFERVKIPWDVFRDDWTVLEAPERKLVFLDEEDEQRTKAMIAFCTDYENELFEIFYKWFKKERKED